MTPSVLFKSHFALSLHCFGYNILTTLLTATVVCLGWRTGVSNKVFTVQSRRGGWGSSSTPDLLTILRTTGLSDPTPDPWIDSWDLWHTHGSHLLTGRVTRETVKKTLTERPHVSQTVGDRPGEGARTNIPWSYDDGDLRGITGDGGECDDRNRWDRAGVRPGDPLSVVVRNTCLVRTVRGFLDTVRGGRREFVTHGKSPT